MCKLLLVLPLLILAGCIDWNKPMTSGEKDEMKKLVSCCVEVLKDKGHNVEDAAVNKALASDRWPDWMECMKSIGKTQNLYLIKSLAAKLKLEIDEDEWRLISSFTYAGKTEAAMFVLNKIATRAGVEAKDMIEAGRKITQEIEEEITKKLKEKYDMTLELWPREKE